MSTNPSSSKKTPSPRPPSTATFSSTPRGSPSSPGILSSSPRGSQPGSSALPHHARQSSKSTMAPSSAIPDNESGDADLPMTMNASVVLTALPGDAREALEKVADRTEGGVKGKVTIQLHALRDAPRMAQTKFNVKSNQPFGTVILFLRKKLKLEDSDGLWCYCGNFAPAPDEAVGGLWNCFKTGEVLSVSYSTTPTFG